MKILIYGGSFDPVHRGHLALLKAATKQIKPDYTHIFTAYQSPYKQKSPVSFTVRQGMARAALGGLWPNIIFDDFELRQKRVVYTWETIKHVRKLYPGADIYFLVGTDCLNTLHSWKNAGYIFENAIIIAGARKGFRFETKKFNFEILKGSFPQISSTQIRLAIMCGGQLPVSILLPQTAAFIEQNLMYGLNIHKWLAANLRPKRYLHVKLVAQAAADLARAYNIDAERAALAAVLHDMAKGMAEHNLINYAVKNKLKVRDFADICKYAPSLLHAAASADMAKKIFGVKDKEILGAIAKHTLGARQMTALEKIIFTADMCAKDRKYSEARMVRASAQKSLDEGMLAAMAIKLNFTIQTRKWLAPAGPELWNELTSQKNFLSD